MNKQGIIVVSFPRSGSSEFIRRLALLVHKHGLNQGRPMAQMGEFFHWADTTAHGNLLHAKTWFESKETPLSVKVLQPCQNIPKIENKKNSLIFVSHFLNEIDKTFLNRDEAIDYYIAEFSDRIHYVNDHLVNNYFPLIKSFPGFTDFLSDGDNLKDLQETLVEKLTNFEPIFYYKRNLVDCILSDLIKWYYIVKPSIDSNSTVDGFTGHNFGNQMRLLEPKKGMRINLAFWKMTKVFCKTLKIYQQNKMHFKNAISYDQVFVDDEFEINFDNVNYKVSNIKDSVLDGEIIEYPMNYSAPRQDYFENTNEIIELLKRDIDAFDLGNVVDELKLIIE